MQTLSYPFSSVSDLQKVIFSVLSTSDTPNITWYRLFHTRMSGRETILAPLLV